MSLIIELTGSATATTAATAAATAELIKEWSTLRKTKKEEELKTPEWQKLEQAYIAHLMWRFQYPEKVFGQQIVANWIITMVVLSLVICGIVFSFLQLQYALTLGDFASLGTSVEIETAGRVTISSSIVGAVTLVISLAFFALYLKYVFQIKHTHPPHVSLSETDARSLLSKTQKDSDSPAMNTDDMKVVRVTNG